MAVRAINPLVGRTSERAELARALEEAAAGRGGFVLVAGEAGIGKTRLVRDAFLGSELSVVEAAAQPASSPYGPIVSALREYLRAVPEGLADCGPLSGYLALLLPEIGTAPERADRSTLFEVLRCAFAHIGRQSPHAVFLDDLHWADDATLELLAGLAAALDSEPVLLIGAYRSDEIPRGHPLRALRTALRRAGTLRELALEPLGQDETAELVEAAAGARADRALATIVYLRTQGIPFFVEELTAALAAAGRLQVRESGVELIGAEDLPLPESVRDAILLRAAALPHEAQRALEVAAVAGQRFAFDLVAGLGEGSGLEQAIEGGFVTEVEPGVGAFRHALTREALYQAVPWTRRRALHSTVAAHLEQSSAQPGTIAEHWIGARNLERARLALLAAAEAACAVHAYRDAAAAARRALDLWPEEHGDDLRLEVLERLGECAELSGDSVEAVRVWREAADSRAASGDHLRFAWLQRRIAGALELQCAWDAALAARLAAAETFAGHGLPAEAALDRLTAAANVQSAGGLTAALDLSATARREADAAGRLDLATRAVGLEALVRARLGDRVGAVELARNALEQALAENLIGPAAEIHDRLGLILENTSDYAGALATWDDAYAFCDAHGLSDRGYVCLACLAYVKRKTGAWREAAEILRKLKDDEEVPRSSRSTGLGELGLIHVLRGDTRRARALLRDGFALAQRIGFLIVEIDAAWGLARLAELEARPGEAVERARYVLDRARRSEDCHCPLSALRWATTFFARTGDGDSAGACVQQLVEMATGAASAEGASAVAHGLGELSLLNGAPDEASAELRRSADLLADVDLPLERAETELRAGVALAAAGEREAAIGSLADAYHRARKLGARPLAQAAAAELAALGEQVDRRIGRRAAEQLAHGGLTRRELEVVRFVAAGRTNREIASDLFLSPRTVDMHVRNVLAKLDCRSRIDAARKADELGLLAD